jgi:Nucleotidyl transferase AbiEii toxin, Type IV TA system
VNESFQRFLTLSVDDRRDVFEAAAESLDTRSAYIEKDFWVSVTLDILYNGSTQQPHRILFKGGTSLSKVYGLIQRFSEDVDFTIFSQDLGFKDDRDPNILGLSKKKREKLSDEIIEQTSKYICSSLKSDLEQALVQLSAECSIEIGANDRSTLLLHYPSLFENDEYVQPTVKLEGGGRSAVDPHQKYSIQPLISPILKNWDFLVPNIITIDAQRTFWDKVFILHGLYYGYQDENRVPSDRQRLSRHYYDVAKIYNTDIGKQAIKNVELREKVRQHKLDFFNSAWKRFDLAVPGSLLIVPYDNLQSALEHDYQAMQGMMLGDAPEFGDILTTLENLQSHINAAPICPE